MSITENEKKSLIKYVLHYQSIDDSDLININALLRKQIPVSMTVYRGQKHYSEIKSYEDNVISTSKDVKVASSPKFKDRNCCLFEIHLHDVPVLDVNKYVRNFIGSKSSEKEIIIPGGGTFYSTDTLTEKGFDEISAGKYRTHYTLNSYETNKTTSGSNNKRSIVKSNINEVKRIYRELSENNLTDMISNKNDMNSMGIDVSHLSHENVNMLLKMIRNSVDLSNNSNVSGGGKSKRKGKGSKKQRTMKKIKPKRKKRNKTLRRHQNSEH